MIRHALKLSTQVWADLSLRGKGMVVVAIPLAGLFVVTLAYFISELQHEAAETLLVRTFQLRTDMRQAKDSLLEAEDGVRKYVATGRESFAAPYEKARKTVPEALAGMAHLVEDDPDLVKRMVRVTDLTKQLLDTLAALRLSDRSGQALSPVQEALLAKEASLADALRVEFRGMSVGEDRMLAARTAGVARVNRQMFAMIVMSIPLGLSCSLLAMLLFILGIVRRVQVIEGDAVMLATGAPITTSPPGNDEIGQLGQALKRSSALLVTRERELRAAQEEANRANQAKSEFLSHMSHELRTPLNAILGFSQLLEMDSLSPDQRESVEQVLKGGRYLLSLINEVLDIARIEAGRLAISLEPVRVKEVVQESLALVLPIAADRGVLLQETPGGIPDRFVHADRQRLKQILLNFLSNAVKYNNNKGGRVLVSSEEIQGGRLRLNVSDNGPGIPAEKLKRAFTSFERLGAEQTDVEGTGLGLALSRRLADAMGGSLGVDSTVGRGSTFWIELPLAEGKAVA
jgi:signal transduction histidine kinase